MCGSSGYLKGVCEDCTYSSCTVGCVGSRGYLKGVCEVGAALTGVASCCCMDVALLYRLMFFSFTATAIGSGLEISVIVEIPSLTLPLFTEPD